MLYKNLFSGRVGAYLIIRQEVSHYGTEVPRASRRKEIQQSELCHSEKYSDFWTEMYLLNCVNIKFSCLPLAPISILITFLITWKYRL